MDRMDTGSTSGHDSPSGLADRAQQACSSCRKQKRRCDKALPACGLCLRMGRACDYYDSSVPPTSDDFHFLRQRVLHLELKLEGRAGSSVASPDLARGPFASRSTPARDAAMGMLVGGGSPRAAPDFPSIFFLDGNAFKHKNITISKNHMPPPPEVAEALGSTADMQLVVDTYFTTIHSWLPIISKKRLPRHLQNPLADPGADLALLFLCMKLLAEPSSEHPESPKTPLYHMAKRFYFLVELHGINSLQLIQAAILLALYEVGNAIYPAAYLSVGHCVQLGYALGLHDRKSVQMLKKAGTWTETEERRRVWWAIIVLDRYVNVGNLSHPLSSVDPNRDDCLPVDDRQWDEGDMMANEPLFVSSSTTIRVPPFARLCQSIHLLGKVLRHTNDRFLEPNFRFEEATLLSRTVQALSASVSGEMSEDSTGLSIPLAICFSALMTLYDPYSCPESSTGALLATELELQKQAIVGLKTVIKEVVDYSRHLQATLRFKSIENSSPFVTDCLYQAAASYVWLLRESGDPEQAQALNEIRTTLGMVDGKWRVAGEYLRILDASEYYYSMEGN